MPDLKKEPAKKIEFDDWSNLAKTDPEAFEARRADVIEAHIRRAPPERQMHLRRLQWRIDQVRRTSGTPLAACIRISRMMWDSVLGEGGLLETLKQADGLLADRAVPALARRAPATILAFDAKRRTGKPH